MEIKESGENYLETILTLEKKNNVVRVVDIANQLGFSKPSVTKAMSILKKAGYITQQSYGNIFLTESGRKKANEVYDRHQLITNFLVNVLNIDYIIAEQDACRIEHVVSETTIEKIRLFLKNK